MQERRKRKINAEGESESSSKRTSTMSSTVSDVFDTAINRNQSGSCIIFTELIRKDKPVHSSNSGIHNFNNFIKAPQGRFFYEKGPVIIPCSIPFDRRCAQTAEAML